MKDDRRTPPWFYRLCEARFGPFDLDVAASAENHLCEHWLGPGGVWEDALSETPWTLAGKAGVPVCTAWENPPYGPTGVIPQWIARTRRERDQHGLRTLMLLPADTSTQWFHDLWRTELCELVPFRLAFATATEAKPASAKFGSLLAWIAPRLERQNPRR